MSQTIRKKYQVLPRALQKQILLRMGVTVISIFLFTLSAAISRDWYLGVSFLIVGLVSGVAGTVLFVQAERGSYVVVEGICQKIELTAFRHKPKTVYLSAGEHNIRVHLHHYLKKAEIGDEIIIYIAASLPVYREDGCEIVNGYLAMEIRKTNPMPPMRSSI